MNIHLHFIVVAALAVLYVVLVSQWNKNEKSELIKFSFYICLALLTISCLLFYVNLWKQSWAGLILIAHLVETILITLFLVASLRTIYLGYISRARKN